MDISQSTKWPRDSQMTSWPCCGVHADGNLVAHGAGRDKQRCLAAKDLRGAGFQAIDGGVFAVNVVAHFGCSHGGAHGRGGRVTVSLRRSISHRLGQLEFFFYSQKTGKDFVRKSTPGGKAHHARFLGEQL